MHTFSLHARTNTHTHALSLTHTRTHTHAHAHTYPHTYTHTHTNTHQHTTGAPPHCSTQIRVSLRWHRRGPRRCVYACCRQSLWHRCACVCVCVYLFVRVCVPLWVWVCICKVRTRVCFKHTLYIYKYMCIYTYTELVYQDMHLYACICTTIVQPIFVSEWSSMQGSYRKGMAHSHVGFVTHLSSRWEQHA